MKALQITLTIKFDNALISSEEIKFICGTENPRDIERFISKETAPFLTPFDEKNKELRLAERKALMKHAITNAMNTHYSSQELDQST